MRPLRSVMHSPRLTNRNGVLTRTAPASTASGTPHQPIAVAALTGSAMAHAAAPGAGAAEEAGDENEAPDLEPDPLGGPQITAGNARAKAEDGVIDQDV